MYVKGISNKVIRMKARIIYNIYIYCICFEKINRKQHSTSIIGI